MGKKKQTDDKKLASKMEDCTKEAKGLTQLLLIVVIVYYRPFIDRVGVIYFE